MHRLFERPRPRRGLIRARRHPAPRRVRLQSLAQFTVFGWIFLIVGVLGVLRSPDALPGQGISLEPQQLVAADVARPGLGRVVGESGPEPADARIDAQLEAPVESGAPETEVSPEAPADPTPTSEAAEGDDPADPEEFATVLGLSENNDPPPIFREHVVQEGETVSEIAEHYGVTTQDILWNNTQVVDDADLLVVGATLQVPGVSGVIHAVLLGETVSEIALRYDAEIDDIVSFEANEFDGDADNLIEGSMILVPGGRVVPPDPAETPALPDWVRAQPYQGPGEQPQPAPGEPPVNEPEPAPAAEPPPPTWVWPATGRLTSRFGPRHPLGIDISMVKNTPIAAASSGQVIFAGGNACCSYGYYMVIRHADGHETLYAHLSKFEVSNGDWVEAGQLIARSGNTGYSTGPHLHFEINYFEVHQDPMRYLP